MLLKFSPLASPMLRFINCSFSDFDLHSQYPIKLFNYFELPLMSKDNKCETIKVTLVLLYVCRAAFNYPLQLFGVPSKFRISVLFALLGSILCAAVQFAIENLKLPFSKADFK